MASSKRRRAEPLSADLAAKLPVSAKPSTVRCAASGGAGTLLLYGEVGWDFTAAGVTQALAQAGSLSSLDIRISSLGGDVYEGWAIYNVLARHPAATKTVTVEGMAASMASIIAMVGTEIVMPENSYMMIHNPAGVCLGGADDMRTMADLLEHMQGVAAQTYADRSGQSVPVVEGMMNAETYLTADQAVALGFADTVEQPVRMAAKLDLAKLPTLPARMRAALSKEFAMAKPDKTDDTTVPNPVVDPVPPTEAPPHVEDGEPGALPVDAPLAPQPTPPASPGFGPADPVAVAEACAAAGHPELTAGLLRSRASMSAVKADITRAQEITKAAAALGAPKMATPAIAGGVSLETFRAMAFGFKADSETKISTAVPPATATAAGAINERDVYSKMAEQRRDQAAARRH